MSTLPGKIVSLSFKVSVVFLIAKQLQLHTSNPLQVNTHKPHLAHQDSNTLHNVFYPSSEYPLALNAILGVVSWYGCVMNITLLSFESCITPIDTQMASKSPLYYLVKLCTRYKDWIDKRNWLQLKPARWFIQCSPWKMTLITRWWRKRRRDTFVNLCLKLNKGIF